MGYNILLREKKELPVKIVTYAYDFADGQRHEEVEILFVLYGECTVTVGSQSYHMMEEDILLINSHDYHFVNGPASEGLSISFPLKFLLGSRSQNLRFQLNSCGDTANSKYNYVRYIIAQLVKLNASGESHFGTLSLLYALTGHLIDNFQASATALGKDAMGMTFPHILTYIEEHYAENLSLSDLAVAFNLTVPYLSSCFSKHLSTTFLQYYTGVRLSHALRAMLQENTSLEEIAYQNGFSNIRSFTSAFKKMYNCLPSAYRKQYIEITEASTYTDISTTFFQDEFKALAKYLNIYNDTGYVLPMDSAGSTQINAGTVSMQAEGVVLQHTFKKLCCVGSARLFLYADIQEMIRKTQAEIGYEYVKFHGILSDEMMVYHERPDGSPIYSFALVDKVLDFIISVNLKPLIQLSFMPRMLASDPARQINMWHFNTSPPKDITKWTDLVHAFTTHLISRYGLEQVRSWLFCVWNEPDSGTKLYGWDDQYLFFEFYKRTYCTVKSIDSSIRFGTPSLLISPQSPNSWTSKFLRYCHAANCPPDFINIHYYDNSLFEASQGSLSTDPSNMGTFSRLTEDQFAFNTFIDQLKNSLKAYRMGNIPVYLTEWNLTISHRDLINDTCFKSCYLVKNLLQNYDRLDSFGYWCLSDFIEELQLPNELFHGGLGMFTYGGIPKAHYYAFRFLNHLRGRKIAEGKGYFVTRSNNDIMIIAYNYEHYSKLFAHGIQFDVTQQDRYAPFIKKRKALFRIEVTDIPSNECSIRELFINQQHGSSYDTWVSMGEHSQFDEDEHTMLQEKSLPGQNVRRQKVLDGTLTLEAEMEPLEVRLIQIRPI